MIRKLNHAGMALFVFLSLTAVMLWMTGNLRVGPGAGAPLLETADTAHAGDEGEEEHAGEAEDEGHHDHDEDAGGSADLSELEARECEHDVRTVDCDKCRFELGVVKLGPALMEVLLTTASVEERIAADVRRVTGEVQADPTRQVEVVPPAAGRVTQVNAFLGQTVRQGDVLAVINSSEFGEAKASLLEAKARLQLARTVLEREQNLYQKKISSEADYFEARKEFQAAEAHYAAAEKRLHLFGLDHAQMEAIDSQEEDGHFADLILRAPRGGRICSQNIAEGKLVDGTQSLYTICDLSNLWVWCDVYERDLAALHAGLAAHGNLEANVGVAAFKGVQFPGRVDLIGSELDEHTRTVKIRVQVANRDERLRPGMFADVDVFIPSNGKLTVAPRDSVLHDEGRHFVFQHWREDLWVRRDVQVGRALGPYIEILDGVENGASVIAGGAFMLKSDVLRGKMGAGCAD